MTKVGVILSGCGYLDGSEIYEAVLTLLALDRGGAQILAIAPDVEEAQVVNHYNQEETRGRSPQCDDRSGPHRARQNLLDQRSFGPRH